ncbi:MAG: hypothetical protein LCH81_05870 [Bacteroidetes bacterium]|nr:hypothetical protein [Bacteroidota bacterium]
MKFSRYFALFFFFLFAVSVTAPACSKKSGCPATESLKPKTNKKGELKTNKKGSQSGLFPKKMKKKM